MFNLGDIQGLNLAFDLSQDIATGQILGEIGSTPIPPEEDYVLHNALLSFDGKPLLTSTGEPLVRFVN